MADMSWSLDRLSTYINPTLTLHLVLSGILKLCYNNLLSIKNSYEIIPPNYLVEISSLRLICTYTHQKQAYSAQFRKDNNDI